MKLKGAQVKETREALMEMQGQVCGLCKLPFDGVGAVHLDHDHKTGAIRGALHGGCNLMMGYVEGRKGAILKNRWAWIDGLAPYLHHHQTDRTGLIHPTHYTPEEKKVRAKAKVARRKKRVQ